MILIGSGAPNAKRWTRSLVVKTRAGLGKDWRVVQAFGMISEKRGESLLTKNLSRASALSIGLTAWGLLSGSAFAQDQTSIHPDLRGVWSFENCADNDASFLVAHGTMVVLIEGGDASSLALVTAPDLDAASWVTGRVEDQPLFFRRVTGTPDVLEFATAEASNGETAITEGPGLAPYPSVWNVERATSCEALPPGLQALYGETFAVLAGLDAAETACATGPKACADALLSVGDVSPNGSLNTAEISRLVRVLVQLGAIENGNGDADEQAGMIAVSVPLAPILARALISSFDYDGDDGLSLEEILGDRVVLPFSDMSQFLTGAESRVSDMMDTLETRASDLGRLLMMMR